MAEPVVADAGAHDWETWPEELLARRGDVFWKTLIGAAGDANEALTLGIARLPRGGTLHEHRHEQAEVYLVTAGEGVVTVDGRPHAVRPGVAVFIPGNARHSCANLGACDLHLVYVLAADSFDDVEYVFEPQA